MGRLKPLRRGRDSAGNVGRERVRQRGGAGGGGAPLCVAAAFNVAGYHALLFWGQQFTTAGVAAIIVGLNPVLTTVFSRALLADERVGTGGVVGLALGMTGIVLLATLKQGNLLDLQGVAELAVGGAIASWCLGSV